MVFVCVLTASKGDENSQVSNTTTSLFVTRMYTLLLLIIIVVVVFFVAVKSTKYLYE